MARNLYSVSPGERLKEQSAAVHPALKLRTRKGAPAS
jgi:hypothetical protein